MATAQMAQGDHAHADPTGWRRYVYSTNHKDIGTMYLWFAIFAGVIGGLLSVVMRLELAHPGIQYFNGLAQMVYGVSADSAIDNRRRKGFRVERKCRRSAAATRLVADQLDQSDPGWRQLQCARRRILHGRGRVRADSSWGETAGLVRN